MPKNEEKNTEKYLLDLPNVCFANVLLFKGSPIAKINNELLYNKESEVGGIIDQLREDYKKQNKIKINSPAPPPVYRSRKVNSVSNHADILGEIPPFPTLR